MLSLTRRTEYAVIALCYLAQNKDRVCAAREIADQYQMPSALLMNVLKALSHSDLVNSTRGARGGYRLGKAEADITLSSVIFAVEGPVQIVPCAGHHESGDAIETSGNGVASIPTAVAKTPESCEMMGVCPIKIPVQRIQSRLESLLNEITLADMLDNQLERDCQGGVQLSVHGEHLSSRDAEGATDEPASSN